MEFFETIKTRHSCRSYKPEPVPDELLEKVHREGIHSLGWRERRFLKAMSRRR